MSATSAQGAAPHMSFTLPPLPYSFDALEPYIDAKTMEIHHDKHHNAYVTNLNKALESAPDFGKLSIEELCAQIGKSSGKYSHRRAQQRRRPPEPLHVLEADEEGRRRRTLRRSRQRDLQRFRQLRRFQNQVRGSRRRAASAPAGPGCSSATASSPSNPRPIRTIPSWTAARPSSASTSGSTPTISSIRTVAPTTSKPGGTSSTGRKPPTTIRLPRRSKPVIRRRPLFGRRGISSRLFVSRSRRVHLIGGFIFPWQTLICRAISSTQPGLAGEPCAAAPRRIR